MNGAGSWICLLYFYPRSPCGERQELSSSFLDIDYNFYPRSPCGERLSHLCRVGKLFQFLSTLSLRRATLSSSFLDIGYYISIHALLAESDNQKTSLQHPYCLFLSTLSLRRATVMFFDYAHPGCYFYPRSPCGERPERCRMLDLFIVFLSTLSLRRATQLSPDTSSTQCISIHALLAESDDVIAVMTDAQSISIHALLAESDPNYHRILLRRNAFLSTLSLRRATSSFLVP